MENSLKPKKRLAPTTTVSLTDRNSNAGAATEFDVIEGTLGPSVIAVSKLYPKTGYFTYDPGFMATASCQSKITFIDGEKGILLHRGYPIEALAEQSTFLEVCYLLLFGELPSQQQHAKFSNDVTMHTMVHEQLIFLFRGFRRDAQPMAIMVGVVGALSAFYHDALDVNDDDDLVTGVDGHLQIDGYDRQYHRKIETIGDPEATE